MTKALVKAEYILRALPFMSDEETRFYLCGVYVCPSPSGQGVHIVATDGHRMLVQYDETGSCSESFIFNPTPAMRAALKGMKRDAFPRYAEIQAEGTRGTLRAVFSDGKGAVVPVDDTAASFELELIDGTFPDYTRVVPRTIGKPALIGFNGRYMAGFGKAVASQGDGSSSIVVCADDAESPALVLWPSRPDILGVLMPVRAWEKGKLPATVAPAWMYAPEAEAKAA